MWIFLSFAVETAADHGFAGINQRAGPDMSISADLMESWKVSVYHTDSTLSSSLLVPDCSHGHYRGSLEPHTPRRCIWTLLTTVNCEIADSRGGNQVIGPFDYLMLPKATEKLVPKMLVSCRATNGFAHMEIYEAGKVAGRRSLGMFSFSDSPAFLPSPTPCHCWTVRGPVTLSLSLPAFTMVFQ
jgi:hypothetical protein